MQTKSLLKKIKKYKELQAQALDISVQLDLLKSTFKKELKEQNIDELLIDEYKVSLLKYDRVTFDSDSFKVKHKKMYDNYSHTIHIESIVVK